ncbi:MAG: C40 family peptidase [Spirochaetes bacterium]|nr:C40 family peptidase [Spirochaetota bacterium]
MRIKFIILLIFGLYSTAYPSEKSRTEIVQELFRVVENWMGTPYLWGGKDKGGVDCSAFVKNVYKHIFNVDIPRTVKEQQFAGTLVKDKLEPGDLVFFNTTGKVSHVGIYVFGDKFIHSASSGKFVGVIKSSLNEKYYKKSYLFARRIIKLPPYKNIEPKVKYYIGNYYQSGKPYKIGAFLNSKPIYIQYPKNSFDELKVVDKIDKNIVLLKQIYGSMTKITLKAGNYKIIFLRSGKIVADEEISVNR